MLVLRILFFLVCIPVSFGVSALTLGIKGENATSIGIHIQEISSGRVIESQGASLALVPASILKSFTSASAMSMLGPSAIPFRTRAALIGRRSGDVWHGNVEIFASGDPTLDSRHFPENADFASGVADAIAASGIKSIIGEVVVARSSAYHGVLPTWEVEDVGWDYGAGLWGFNWKDNTFTFSPSDAVTDPCVADFRFAIRQSDGETQFIKGVGSDSLTIFTNRSYKPGQKLTTTMSDPSRVFSDNLRIMLLERGIEVRPDNSPLSATSDTLMLISHNSPPVKDILKSLMHRSDNMMAEGMLRRLERVPVGVDSAIALECAFWKDLGLEPKYTTIRDGSGLSRGNRIRPEYLASVLRYMARSGVSNEYIDLFPRCGRDGTVRSFLAGTSLAGRIVLKSGSMSGVHCYAGYKLDASGRPTHTIVIMVNGFFCTRAELRKAIERYLLKVFT